jgi:hypothetical protein
LGCELPATLTFEFPTTRALADFLLAEYVFAAPTEAHPTDAADPQGLSAPDGLSATDGLPDLDGLSDEELARRLDAALDGTTDLLLADDPG